MQSSCKQEAGAVRVWLNCNFVFITDCILQMSEEGFCGSLKVIMLLCKVNTTDKYTRIFNRHAELVIKALTNDLLRYTNIVCTS